MLDTPGIINEKDFVQAYKKDIAQEELRKFITHLEQANAIDVIG